MSRKYSTAVGLAAGAAAAAFIGMGTAHADPAITIDSYYDSPGVVTAGDTVLPNDAYDMLFGAAGTTTGTQGFEDNAADVSAADSSVTNYEAFTNDVVLFEENAGEHGLENLIYAIDPSAFYLQTTDGVTGTVAETVSGVDGAYLVPDDFLGYLATGLDYGLLTPTGLDYVLTPLIDLLAGSPI